MITKKNSKKLFGIGAIAVFSLLTAGCPSPFGFFASEQERAAQIETNETAPAESVASPFILTRAISAGGQYYSGSFNYSVPADAGDLSQQLVMFSPYDADPATLPNMYYQSVAVDTEITLASETTGADIYYTTDSSMVTPNANSTIKLQPGTSIKLSGDGSTVFIRSMGLKTLYYPSPVSLFALRVDYSATDFQGFAQIQGDHTDPFTVQIVAEDGAAIYYTSTNDVDVEPADPKVSGALYIPGSISLTYGDQIRIKAYAKKSEKKDSAVKEISYRVILPPPTLQVQGAIASLNGASVVAENGSGGPQSYMVTESGTTASTEYRLAFGPSSSIAPPPATASWIPGANQRAITGPINLVPSSDLPANVRDTQGTVTVKARKKGQGGVWSEVQTFRVLVIDAVTNYATLPANASEAQIRAAVAAAANGGTHVIDLSNVSGTYTFTPSLVLGQGTGTVYIIGPALTGPADVDSSYPLQFSGGSANRIFEISGGTISIANLLFKNGLYQGEAGDFSTNGSGGAGGGAGGVGGAIFAYGTLTNLAIVNARFTDNSARGGNGGGNGAHSGAYEDGASGGGIDPGSGGDTYAGAGGSGSGLPYFSGGGGGGSEGGIGGDGGLFAGGGGGGPWTWYTDGNVTVNPGGYGGSGGTFGGSGGRANNLDTTTPELLKFVGGGGGAGLGGAIAFVSGNNLQLTNTSFASSNSVVGGSGGPTAYYDGDGTTAVDPTTAAGLFSIFGADPNGYIPIASAWVIAVAGNAGSGQTHGANVFVYDANSVSINGQTGNNTTDSGGIYVQM